MWEKACNKEGVNLQMDYWKNFENGCIHKGFTAEEKGFKCRGSFVDGFGYRDYQRKGYVPTLKDWNVGKRFWMSLQTTVEALTERSRDICRDTCSFSVSITS